jgi:hypothetical protein
MPLYPLRLQGSAGSPGTSGERRSVTAGGHSAGSRLGSDAARQQLDQRKAVLSASVEALDGVGIGTTASRSSS